MIKSLTFISISYIFILTSLVIFIEKTTSVFDQAPDISLQSIDGYEFRLNTLLGKPLLVTFWATSCTICTRKIPDLITLYNQYQQEGLSIVGIAMSYDPPNRVMEFSKQLKIPYLIAIDTDGNAAKAFGKVTLTPATFLIAPDGRVIEQRTGEIDIDKLTEEITNLLPSKKQLATLNKQFIGQLQVKSMKSKAMVHHIKI